MIKYLNNIKDFDELINDDILVDFYAEWCGPCQMLAPILEKLDYNTLKVDVDKYQDLALKYNVMSIPTIIHFKNGQIVKKNTGFLDYEQLKKFMGI